MDVARKVLRVAAGFLLLGVGLLLSIPGVPGPGIAVMILGLILLSSHFHWARRMLDWLKQRAERVRDHTRWRRTPTEEKAEHSGACPPQDEDEPVSKR